MSRTATGVRGWADRESTPAPSSISLLLGSFSTPVAWVPGRNADEQKQAAPAGTTRQGHTDYDLGGLRSTETTVPLKPFPRLRDKGPRRHKPI